MNFMENLQNVTSMTKTENGASAKTTTMNPLVDLFAVSGALRNRSEQDISQKFSRAFSEDLLLGTKLLFYTRDIRFGGIGERRTFRMGLRLLAERHPKVVNKNIENIPYFGRFDDLYVLFDTECEDAMLSFLENQWKLDIENMSNNLPISLMAKWLPSENSKNATNKKRAIKIINKLGMKPKYYRKALSSMREYLKVTEKFMCDNRWTEIEYSKVPSYAMNKYRTAFYKHDEDGIKGFIDSLQKGETKINSSTLFPYDIVEKIGIGYSRRINSKQDLAILNAQWDALPNYVDGENNVLVMADVSGSMNGRPLCTSIGLAIYFAERNKGAFANKFMTFSEIPEIQTVLGSTLKEKIDNLSKAKWDMNTNLELAYDAILRTAISSSAKQEDLPKSLVIITDMEMDRCVRQAKSNVQQTFHDKMVERFNQHGYEMPNTVFWNVNSRNDVYQVSNNVPNVQLVSGQSASTFKVVLGNIGKTPYETMLDTLNNEVYNRVII